MFRGCLEFFRRGLEFGPCKVDIIGRLHWHQMHMGVRDFKPYHRYTDPLAFNSFLKSHSNLFCKHHHVLQISILHIKNVINLLFRNNKNMAGYQRHQVKKSYEPVILQYYMGRNFAVYNPAKNGSHAVRWLYPALQIQFLQPGF